MTWENGKWMKKSIGKMDERLNKMDERREENHREVIELLKRSFGDLSREHEEIKEKVS